MTIIAAAGRPQKNIRVALDEDEYQKQISNAEFAPTVISWQGGTEDATLTDSTWVCNVTAIQAYDDPESFVRFCLEHEGEKVPVVYQPHDDATFGIESTLTIVAPTIGGAVNQFNESTMALPCTKPKIVVVTLPAG